MNYKFNACEAHIKIKKRKQEPNRWPFYLLLLVDQTTLSYKCRLFVEYFFQSIRSEVDWIEQRYCVNKISHPCCSDNCEVEMDLVGTNRRR